MKTYLLTLTFCLISLIFSSAKDGGYHLFILSGQSNMQGMNPNIGLMPEAKKLFKNTEVKYIKVAKGEDQFGFGLKSGTRLQKSTNSKLV